VNEQVLRDLLYFDFDKAASLWSQLAGGLRERVSVTAEEQSKRTGGVSAGISSWLGGKYESLGSEKQSTLESKVLHHDLLNMLNHHLNEMELVVDLNQKVSREESSPEKIRDALDSKPYVIAEGWAVIEDYQRIQAIAQEFNQIGEFVGTCSAQKDPKVQQLLKQREEKQQAVEKAKDKNAIVRLNRELESVEKQISTLVRNRLQLPEKWILDGITHWIETFMRNRINCRIYPFEDCPSFQLLCNLKRECFVDEDLEHLLYGYSNRPNVPLAVFGLVTSLPRKDDPQFNPMKEFESESTVDATLQFEKGFRDLFDGMEGIESFIRYSRYPNISVHPIAVFRQFRVPAIEKK
jgi:hypothetical protein